MTPEATGWKEEGEELGRQVLCRRREFLKRTLITSAYATPVVMSFAAADLARATGGKNEGKGHKYGRSGKDDEQD